MAMARMLTGGAGLLQGVAELTRGLEAISRRVSRSIDRAVRQLESRAEPSLERHTAAPSTASAATVTPGALLAIDGLTLEAELAALEALKNSARDSRTADAAMPLKALAQDILELTQAVDTLNGEALGVRKNTPGRREPVMAAALPAKVVSFTEAARNLANKKSRRRQA